ncbi:cerebellar degeneration-related protein 2-like isoform X2 [Pomacea canaliculata]|uniref:cerebellar degeneration-related protein 2-like isoform X2 n=1 Tax=Pomacea canaliculata TaxID=400727 RepID=UPI000D735FBF|nr:cerebellar degeneration-related protein 2-like isoform X2 [Pomacea canaliculata]
MMMEELCETYETGEDFSEDYYENDLQLAAELGKALLERNRDLELQLQQLQQLHQEQNMELQHVTKQLETLRTMTESRNRVYEEVDRISQDLERQNQKLTMDARADKQKIERLTASVEQLEQKVEDLYKKLEESNKSKDNNASIKIQQEKRRTASLASLNESHCDNRSSFYIGNLAWTQSSTFKNLPLNPWEAELLKLQEAVQHCKTQLTIERRRREDLEVELDITEQENKSLQTKVTILEDRLSEAMMLEFELEQARQSPEGICRKCRKVLDIHEELHAQEKELLSEVEHDSPELLSKAKAVKLEGGGSLYGSSESINKVTADAKEIDDNDAGKSILDELETQYKSLFQKYEALIQNKSKRLSMTQTDDENPEDRAMRRRLAHKEVQTLLHMTLNRDYFQESCQPPPYKALFKDLFATLRKSRIDENPEQDRGAITPGGTPITSPSMEFLKAGENGRAAISPVSPCSPLPGGNVSDHGTKECVTSAGISAAKGLMQLAKEEVFES